jgi:signal transduction histidine kinase
MLANATRISEATFGNMLLREGPNLFRAVAVHSKQNSLGLSISHDIIVKQHAGSIEIDTMPGEFTEITVILPRAAVFV